MEEQETMTADRSVYRSQSQPSKPLQPLTELSIRSTVNSPRSLVSPLKEKPTGVNQERVVPSMNESVATPWYSARWGYRLFETFRRSWFALDRTERRQWLLTLFVGWLAVVVFLVALTIGMRFVINQGYISNAWEEMILLRIVHYAPIEFSHAVWLGAAGDPIVIIPVFLVAAIIAARAGYPLRALSIAASYLLVSLLVLLGWTIWDRPRPTLVINGMAAPDLHSFPSGHMAQSMAVYGMIWYFWLRKIRHKGEYIVALLLLVLWIGIIAVARLLLGAHWVTDIIAGVLVGLAWLAVLIRALHRIEQQQ